MGMSEALQTFILNSQNFPFNFILTLFNLNSAHLDFDLQIAIQNLVLNLVSHPEFETNFLEPFQTWTQTIAQAASQSPENVAKWVNVDLIVYQLNKHPDFNKNLLEILIELVHYGEDKQMMT